MRMIQLNPHDTAQAEALFDRVADEFVGLNWEIIANVTSNLMAAFMSAFTINDKPDPEYALEMLTATAREFVASQPANRRVH